MSSDSWGNSTQPCTYYSMIMGQMEVIRQGELRAIGQVKANTLVIGDCLEVMKYIAGGSIDAIITDLPYG